MLGALANSTTHIITSFLMGEDCLSTIDCFRKMGVEINITDDEVIVEGVVIGGSAAVSKRHPEARCTPTWLSGTTTRLLCGILASQPFHRTAGGDVHPEAPDGSAW